MNLDVFSYDEIVNLESNPVLADQLNDILRSKGIVGIRGVPGFVEHSIEYLKAARDFCALQADIKNLYAPNRDAGLTEGYELGAEWFKNAKGEWQIDDKKASYYAFVPDKPRNIWPSEVNLRDAYLALGELMLKSGTLLLSALGIAQGLGITREDWSGYGRLLHYEKAGNATEENPEWCGAHFDHCALTALLPAFYFRDNVEVSEPLEAGLHIVKSDESDFVKMHNTDNSVLLFQVGEFSQIASDDRIKATKHLVRKAYGNIERFAFAVFIEPPYEVKVRSQSELAHNPRYANSRSDAGDVSYKDWCAATYEQYRVR